jgi:hypothetical protein
VTIVDGAAMPWVNGQDVYDSMEPAFRNNFGGEPDQVRELLSRYWMRSLWLDPATTRRIDHIRTTENYRDLSEAYHDSVEEAYFIGGEADLSAEGHLVDGDYFWRPPGWVHKAWSDKGFENILCMEGEVASEHSGRVSRVICGDHEGGKQAGSGGIGPRGYVRRLETRFLPWGPYDDGPVGIGGAAGKLLSVNVDTGARSVLVRLAEGHDAPLSTLDRERFVVNAKGTLVVDGVGYDACSLVHLPAGAPAPRLAADGDVDLFVKVGEPV